MDQYLLSKVQRPARYSGGELGLITKTDAKFNVCFCFPDTYEVGMSHLGLQILYGVANSVDNCWCRRAFAPWTDAEELLTEYGAPLTDLETDTPLKDFHCLAFTLQYELCYTNVLNMLKLGGVPLRRENRRQGDPIVIAGGPCAVNPAPMAAFIDAFAIGDGEEVFVEILSLLRDTPDRDTAIKKLSELDGVFVPAYPKTTKRRIVRDLDAAFYPTKPIVPSTEVIHDRAVLELFRGCIRGCRFCQAGWGTRPVRQRSVETLVPQAIDTLKHTGGEELALLSLSSSDYPDLSRLCDELLDYCVPRKINLSLPSLRADSFSSEILQKVEKTRKSGLTFAPEAGTQRLRDVINKNLSEQDLLHACETAFGAGYTNIKLYFMIGLPTETDEDILGIAKLAEQVYFSWRRTSPDRGRGVRITVSVSNFVPKPHTPFMWCEMVEPEELARRQKLLKSALRKQISYKYHDPETGILEGVFARGDERLGAVLERALESGCRMDGWSECFSYAKWLAALAAEGLSPADYLRERDPSIENPWDTIDIGIDKKFFQKQYEMAINAQVSPDCRTACSGCLAGEKICARV